MKPFAAALLLSASVLCSADRLADVRKELKADYDLISRSFKAKAIQPMANLMTDDFVASHKGEPDMDKQQVLTSFQQQMNGSINPSWRRKIVSLTLDGDQATAVVEGHFTSGMATPNGKPKKFTMDATSTDTWVKTPQGYRIRKTVVDKMAMSIDGKPIGPRD